MRDKKEQCNCEGCQLNRKLEVHAIHVNAELDKTDVSIEERIVVLLRVIELLGGTVDEVGVSASKDDPPDDSAYLVRFTELETAKTLH